LQWKHCPDIFQRWIHRLVCFGKVYHKVQCHIIIFPLRVSVQIEIKFWAGLSCHFAVDKLHSVLQLLSQVRIIRCKWQLLTYILYTYVFLTWCNIFDTEWKHAALTSRGQILNPPKIYRSCQFNSFNIVLSILLIITQWIFIIAVDKLHSVLQSLSQVRIIRCKWQLLTYILYTYVFLTWCNIFQNNV
jgi:hypothetical protein